MTLQIGDIRVDSVEEFEGPYRDPLEMYPDADATLLDAHRHWMAPRFLDPATGLLVFSFRSFLIRTGRLNILVDTCVGNDKHRPHRDVWHQQNFPWMDNLHAHGISPDEIDIVMCTHLHVDHVGWNTQLRDGSWVPTFPNANYLFHEQEYAFWEAEHQKQEWITDAFEDSVLPVVSAGQATMVKADHEVDNGIWIEPSPGHTPGHVSLNVRQGDSHGVFCGDMMHHPLQIPESQLYSIFCEDPVQSVATREAFIDRHADTDTMILAAHFPGPDTGAGHIVGGMHGDRPGFRPIA